MSQPAKSDLEDTTARIVLVDDEPSVLQGLRRTLWPTGYTLHLAESGEAALQILEREPVDLIVSDMRMPGMNGAELLSQVAEKWPSVVRMLLTGYSDMESTVDAINRGKIHCYISKPVEADALKARIEEGLYLRFLEKERLRLFQITQEQNAQLRDLNSNLEDKVAQRTEQLQQAHKQLKQSYVDAIKVFSSLVDSTESSTQKGLSRRIADVAMKLAGRMELEPEALQQVMFAGLLHRIGRLMIDPQLLHKPYRALGYEDRKRFSQHPALAEATLMSFGPLKEAAAIIRAHREYWDGSGYPDHLQRDDIPLGARILCPVVDYLQLQNGELQTQKLSATDAAQYIRQHSGKLYDPTVVAAFFPKEKQPPKETDAHGAKRFLPSKALRPGMVLGVDLVTAGGVMLLSKGYVIDQALIDKIQRYEKSSGQPLKIGVQ